MIKSIPSAKGTIIIREANLADVIPFRELRLFALQESPTAFSADYQVNAGHPSDYWQDRLKEDDDSVIFFAEHEDQLIGMVGIARGRSPKTKHSAGIWGVFIRPEWRGAHIAEELIKTCTEWAKARAVEIAKLGVVTSNASAVRCYERCGFTVYGTEPRGILYEGKYYDEYLMSRSLGSS